MTRTEKSTGFKLSHDDLELLEYVKELLEQGKSQKQLDDAKKNARKKARKKRGIEHDR